MSANEHQPDAEDQLRGVVRYGRDDPDPGVDAVGVELPPGALEFFLGVSDTRLGGGPYGSHRASIHLLEEVIVVHVPDDGRGGIVATVEPNADATSIGALVERVQEVGA